MCTSHRAATEIRCSSDASDARGTSIQAFARTYSLSTTWRSSSMCVRSCCPLEKESQRHLVATHAHTRHQHSCVSLSVSQTPAMRRRSACSSLGWRASKPVAISQKYVQYARIGTYLERIRAYPSQPSRYDVSQRIQAYPSVSFAAVEIRCI